MIAQTPPWHATPVLLAAYAAGLAEPPDSWSLEAHLISCAACRAELSVHLAPSDNRLLAEQRDQLLAGLPVRAAVYRQARRWSLRWVLRPGPLIAVAVTVVALGIVDALVVGAASDFGMLWLLAPAIPVSGVALMSISENDPCWEAVAAAPAALLRLTLWRTLALHALAIQLLAVAAVIGAMTGNGVGAAVAWLLPSFALTASALALGAFIGVERSSRAIALLWCVAALTPALLHTGGNAVAAFNLAVGTPGQAPTLISGPAQVVWAVVGVFAVALLVSSRARFDRMVAWRGTR
jgi:hypothetical protein